MTTDNNKHYTNSDFRVMLEMLETLDLKNDGLILAHVRLKGLKSIDEISDISYEELTKLVLDVLNELYNPRSILVPTYTYSFTDSGVFHRTFSKSEVGRFSEEVRRKFSEYRLPDPIFSVSETGDYLMSKEGDIDCTSAFGQNCWREHLMNDNCDVINIDIDELRFGLLHYLEHVANVPYRYYKSFDGIVYTDVDEYHDIDYRYFVRDLDVDPRWDRDKIERLLSEAGLLEVRDYHGTKVSSVSAVDLEDGLLEILEDTPELVLENDSLT